MNRQAKLVAQMTDKELLLNLYVTQIILRLHSFIIGLFVFDSWSTFLQLFQWNPFEIFIIGGTVALAVIIFDILLFKLVPKHLIDDGGINERVFANRSTFQIFVIAIVVSFAEEIFFRGVLQTQIGYIPASLLFALIHFRYLSKFILFIVTVMLSFLLGWLFFKTGNLLVPIFVHFTIDFVLGVLLREYLKKRNRHEM